MPFHITILYAGLNGLLILVLTVRVVLTRRAVGIGLGTSGNAALERAARIHGNAIESIPIVLILMGLLEAYRLPAAFIHVLGIMLTLGRLLHVWGLSQSSGASFGRAAGMGLTGLALLAASVAAILTGFGVVLI